jgi:hypothetical protein
MDSFRKEPAGLYRERIIYKICEPTRKETGKRLNIVSCPRGQLKSRFYKMNKK